MISLTTAQIDTWLSAFIWPFSRVLALVATAPVIGNAAFPARVKLGLAVVLTVIIAPLVPPPPSAPLWSGLGIAILTQQILIGTAMGLAMRVVFMAMDMAGELAGLQMGLGFATFFDPQNSVNSPVVAQFFGILATLAFLAMNGHLLLLGTLAQSFAQVPVTVDPLPSAVFLALARWGAQIFLAGLMLALPILAALLITNLALGALTRAAPQLNIFAVGLPVTLLVGFLVIGFSLPHFAPAFETLVHEGLAAMLDVLAARGP